VVDRELELQEREEQDDLSLGRELEALTTHESDLSSRATTLAMEWKDLEEPVPESWPVSSPPTSGMCA
jgi:hypothetical protein